MTTQRLPLTYCSFAHEDSSKNRVLILDGHLDPVLAAMTAHRLKCNPGGQLLAFPIPPEVEDWEYEAYAGNRERLIDLDEASVLFQAKPISEWEADL